jgi:hypothetical protein
MALFIMLKKFMQVGQSTATATKVGTKVIFDFGNGANGNR